MNNSIIKLLTSDAGDSGTIILISVIIFVLVAILLFIYLASCIVIVKQGTRKIVERFGSYNRTLREGIHIIFRPFDRIAPVPWNILSISERDEFEKNMSRKRIPFFNDENRSNFRRLSSSTKKLMNDIKKDIETLKKEDNMEERLKIVVMERNTLGSDVTLDGLEEYKHRSEGQRVNSHHLYDNCNR